MIELLIAATAWSANYSPMALLLQIVLPDPLRIAGVFLRFREMEQRKLADLRDLHLAGALLNCDCFSAPVDGWLTDCVTKASQAFDLDQRREETDGISGGRARVI